MVSTAGALFTTGEIRAIEAEYVLKRPKISLMRRAGAAVAKLALTLTKTARRKTASILVLAGPGNNGGDAWVAAAALKKAGQRVSVLALGEQKFTDAAQLARTEFVRAKGIVCSEFPDAEAFDLIVDGLFGIGLARAPAGVFSTAIAHVNELAKKHESGGAIILSIDVPSGLSSDTGVALGETIIAHHTLTFLGLKPGLYTAEGRDYAGEVHLDTLGVDTSEKGSGHLLTADCVRTLIPSRRHHSHKGIFGNVGIIGGADGMVGAAVLAARAALYMGPGKVFLGVSAKDVPAFDPLNPEIMVRKAEDLINDESLTAFAIGMGLGTDKSAPRLLSAMLGRRLPMVLDADALNLVAATPGFAALLGTPQENTSIGEPFQAKMLQTPHPCWTIVLTPHPGEAARLLNVTVAHLQADRVTSAIALAKRFNSIVVLKGAGTVIAVPDGRYFINTSGNPGMASGGMGDALSGMIAAFLAQGLDALAAAKLAVYLHGAAADACIAHGMAPLGLTASEVIFEARMLLNAGLEHHDH